MGFMWWSIFNWCWVSSGWSLKDLVLSIGEAVLLKPLRVWIVQLISKLVFLVVFNF
ncbi:hypothetical protein HanPI659440_Chr01g0002261 [Helianthus annuus]|nr:hypothetical protein HanPI659440_Chr01g0002261 [Helianthus annuus]